MARVVSESFNIPTNKQLISQSDPTGQFLIAFMGQFLIAFMGQFLIASMGQFLIAFMGQFLIAFMGQFLIAFMGQFLIAFMGQFLVAFVGQGVIDYMNDDRMKANLLPLMNQMRIEQKKADRYLGLPGMIAFNSYFIVREKKVFFGRIIFLYFYFFFVVVSFISYSQIIDDNFGISQFFNVEILIEKCPHNSVEDFGVHKTFLDLQFVMLFHYFGLCFSKFPNNVSRVFTSYFVVNPILPIIIHWMSSPIIT